MIYRWFFIVVFLYIWRTNCCFAMSKNAEEAINLNKMKENFIKTVNSFIESLLPIAYKITEESKISMPCSLSLLRFFTDLKKLKSWTVKMLDAIAKPAAGILEGTFVMFGDYDECLDIVVTNAKGKVYFKGKYCLVELRLSNNISQQIKELNMTDQFAWILEDLVRITFLEGKMLIGVCVPSLCKAQEINRIFHSVVRNSGFVTNVTCETKTKKEPNTEQTVVLFIFAVLGFLTIIGTITDLIKQHSCLKKKSGSGDLITLLKAFSVYSNSIRLFRIVGNDTSLNAIRGSRILTAFWIILGHTYFFPNYLYFLKYRRLKTFDEFNADFSFRTITGISLSVDTFFLLSGMLTVYTTWSILEKNKGWINPLFYFPRRIARILIIEMLLVALLIILPLFGDGPIWEQSFKEILTNCRENWWTNLLFIQNFWPMEQICLFHTWFLGVLMQLSLLGFGILLVLYRWPKIGIFINILLILIGCFVIGIITFSYNLLPYFSPKQENLSKWRIFYDIIYGLPYTYLSSYCIGIILGYFITTKRQQKIKPWIQLISWLLAIFGALVVLYGVYFMEQYDTKELDIVYAALHRAVWSLSISWTLFACVAGYGGIIGKLLSWEVMIPLDRLSFLIYLLHPLVIYYHTARTRAPIYMAHVEQVYIFLATVFITVFFSYLLNVMVEQPLTYIESLFFRRFSKNASPDIMLSTRAISKASTEGQSTKVN